MKLYQVRKTAAGLMIGAFILAVVGYLFAKANAVFSVGLCVVAVTCIVAYWVLLMKLWRCPRCGALLPVGQGFFSVKHCPECGEELDLNRW